MNEYLNELFEPFQVTVLEHRKTMTTLLAHMHRHLFMKKPYNIGEDRMNQLIARTGESGHKKVYFIVFRFCNNRSRDEGKLLTTFCLLLYCFLFSAFLALRLFTSLI